MREDVSRGADDEGEVRLAIAGERRRHAYDDRIRVRDRGEVSRRVEAVRGDRLGYEHRGDVANMRFPVIQRSDALVVDVDADHGQAGVEGGFRERKADITHADDGDRRRAV